MTQKLKKKNQTEPTTTHFGKYIFIDILQMFRLNAGTEYFYK